jgi:hypothetical protein
MSGPYSPGKQRFTPAQLRDEAERCHLCQGGWIHVAYGQKEGVWDIFKFPCKCTVPSGKELWELANSQIFRNRTPDYTCTRDDMPGYVFIHPVHNAKQLEKIVGSVRRIWDEQVMVQDEGLPF